MAFSDLTAFYRLLIILAIPSLGWTQTAYLQPQKLFEGDIAELIIEHQSKVPSLYALDTSVLEENFEVLKKSSRLFRVLEADEVINRMQWKVMLSPRRSGKLEVSSLVLGSNQTPSLVLDVARQTPEMLASQKVQLRIESIPDTPYVGQQTIVRLRLLHNTPLINNRLSEPETEHADLYRSGDETRYRLTEGEDEFDVLQRDIALFARSPGPLSLSSVNFLGQIPANLNSSIAPSRQIFRSSDSLVLQVRDIPLSFSGEHWLPARDLQISENWNQPGQNLKIGDSINRHISIVARGLPAESLPENLLVSNTDQIQIYADQADRENHFEGVDIIGSLNQSFVVVFAQAGEFILPELRLSWWDLEENVEREAILPARRLTVIDEFATSDNSVMERRSIVNVRTWLLAGLFVSVIIALFFWLNRPPSKLADFILKTRRLSALKKACLGGHATLARAELLKWAEAQWPEEKIYGLFQMSKKIHSADFSQEIRQLDEALYSPHRKSWNGDRLYRLLRREQRRISIQATSIQSGLPGLYPAT